MKTFTIFLIFCIVGVYSSILEPEEKAKLREVRNKCAILNGLGPYEIGTILRAIHPVEKFVNTSECIVKSLIQQKDQDAVAKEILEKSKILAEAAVVPHVVKHVIATCDKLVGPVLCQKMIHLTGLIIAQIQKNKPPLDHQ